MKKRLIGTLLVLCALSALFCLLFTACGKEKQSFVPPAFDANAVQGTHTIKEGEHGYGVLPPPENNAQYRFGLCGEVDVSEGKADVWLTNPVENKAWIKLRALDEDGDIIGETGLIKPGEYVQSITFFKPPVKGDKITLRVMGYAPETYYSMGEVNMNTVVATSDAKPEGMSVWAILLIVIGVAFVSVAIVFVVLSRKPAPMPKGKQAGKKKSNTKHIH